MKVIQVILLLVIAACTVNGLRVPGSVSGIGSTMGSAVNEQLKKLNLTSATLKSKMATLTTAQKDALCLKALELSSELTGLLGSVGADCFSAISRHSGSVKVDKSQSAKLVAGLRKGKRPGTWTMAEWKTVLTQIKGNVKIADLKNMSSQTFKDLVKDDVFEGIISQLMAKKSTRKVMGELIEQAYGAPSTWDANTTMKLAPFLGVLNDTEINKLPLSTVKMLGNRTCSSSSGPAMEALAKRYLKAVGPASNWNTTDVENAGCLVCSSKELFGKLPADVRQASLSSFSACNKVNTYRSAKFIRTLKRDMATTTITKDVLKKLGHDVKLLGSRTLKNISPKVVQDSLSSLSKLKLSKRDSTILMKSLNRVASNMTAANLKEVGHLARGLSAKEFSQTPTTTFAQLDDAAFSNLACMQFDKAQCRAIVKKVKAANSNRMKEMCNLMSTCMCPSDVSSLDVAALGLDCTSTLPPKFKATKTMVSDLRRSMATNCSKPEAPISDDKDLSPVVTVQASQAKALMNKVRSSKAGSAVYSLECLKNWGSVVTGMNDADFKKLKGDSDFAQKVGTLAEHAAELDENQIKTITAMVRDFLQMANATAVNVIDVDVIEQMGPFMTYFSDAELNAFNASVKAYLAKKFGEMKLDQLPQRELSRLTKFFLRHVERDEDGMVTDRSQSATLDDNDVRDMGQLVRGLTVSHFNKMDAATIASNIENLQGCVRSFSSMKAVLSRVERTFFDYAGNISAAAGLAGAIDSTTMDSAMLGGVFADIVNAVLSRRTMDETRDMAGFKNEVPLADRSSFKTHIKSLIQKALIGFLNGAQTSRRRRRATSPLTCSDVQVLGSAADLLTPTQISTLTAAEFTDCVATLGAIVSWSTDQLASLTTLAKAAYGSDMSTWSEADLKLIGTMVAGLTTTEMATLNITSAETLTTMGTSSTFTSAQAKAVFDRFLSQVRANQASSVTGDDLISMGSFACGVGLDKISSISSENYKIAASSIGSQSTCDTTQLEAFAALAKTSMAYGSPSTWDAATISTLGTVIGGLSMTEIAAFTVTQIQAIDTTTISKIPAVKLAAFGVEQLKIFSSTQTNSITPTQQGSMDVNQQQVLGLLPNSANSVGIPVMGLLLLPLILWFL